MILLHQQYEERQEATLIHIAIVEDEELYRKQLMEYLRDYEREQSVSFDVRTYTDGAEIAEDYPGDLDIILMDIQMKFMDGMTAAEKIRRLDRQVVLMFITNMTQYAIRGYEVEALDYIVKPVEYFSFSQKLNRAIERIPKKERPQVTIPVETGVKKIDLSNIYYIESFGHELVYKTKDGCISSRGTMKEQEEALSPHGFYRVTKSFLVNLEHVDAVRRGCCVVDGDEITISRQKKKDFMEALNRYIGS
jgi:DNA-binding LytR/AlgR family response regulator